MRQSVGFKFCVQLLNCISECCHCLQNIRIISTQLFNLNVAPLASIAAIRLFSITAASFNVLHSLFVAHGIMIAAAASYSRTTLITENPSHTVTIFYLLSFNSSRIHRRVPFCSRWSGGLETCVVCLACVGKTNFACFHEKQWESVSLRTICRKTDHLACFSYICCSLYQDKVR